MFKRFKGCNVSKSAVISKRVILNSCSIGNYSSINSGCDIAYAEIGNYCAFGKDVVIGSRNHIINNFTIHDCIYNESGDHHSQYSNIGIDNPLVRIGNDVWIGTRSIILPGVTIGNGAVIGAGSIVTKSVPSYAIVAGNPATVIRKRFSENIVRKLEDSEWWNLALQDLLMHKSDFEKLVGYQGPPPYLMKKSL